MRKNFTCCRKGMEKLVKNVSKDVLEIVKGETHHPCLVQTINTTSLNDVRKLINDTMDFWLYDEDRNIACSCGMYECPVKTAQEIFSKVDAETIKKALEYIPYETEFKHMEEHGVMLAETAYLEQHCKFIKGVITKVFNSSKVKKTRLYKVANVIHTLGLPKKVFEDFIKVNICAECWNGSFDVDINNIWNQAIKYKKGDTCKICCGQKTNFEDLDAPESINEGDE